MFYLSYCTNVHFWIFEDFCFEFSYYICRIMHVELLWILWRMLMIAGLCCEAEGFCCNRLQQRSPHWTIQLWLLMKELWTAPLPFPRFPRVKNPLHLFGHVLWFKFYLQNNRVVPLQSVPCITLWRIFQILFRQRSVVMSLEYSSVLICFALCNGLVVGCCLHPYLPPMMSLV